MIQNDKDDRVRRCHERHKGRITSPTREPLSTRNPSRDARQKSRSEPISRVLSWAIISLGRRLLDGSSNLPGRCTRRTASRRRDVANSTIYVLLGLASGGVYRAGSVTRSAGALLPHRFTLTSSNPARASPESETTFGGILSVALSRSLRTVGVTHHRVL